MNSAVANPLERLAKRWQRAPRIVGTSPACDWVVALDTLVAGVHFPSHTTAEDVAYKAVAVNLSDLAAMGAEPCSIALTIALPAGETAWLARFCAGLETILGEFSLGLDTVAVTEGPLNISVQAHGTCEAGTIITRDGAQPGDNVYVSGSLGDACLGLRFALGQPVQATFAAARAHCLERLNRPSPRLALGRALRGLASAAIDVSDGLAQDLGHILGASGVGATVEASRLPLSMALRNTVPKPEVWDCALSGGDDYELCFTVPPGREGKLARVTASTSIPVTRIGEITRQEGITVTLPDGERWTGGGYDHFR